jgi:hypothetical protein
MSVDLDRLRGEALRRIDRSERHFKLALMAAVIGELSFLGAFLLAADLRDRLHLLLLLATVSSWTLFVLGLVALGAHVNRGLLRVLKAIEASRGGSA